MSTVSVSCDGVLLRGFSNSTADVAKEIILRIKYRGKIFEVDITEYVYDISGVAHIYDGFQNIINSTVPEKVMINVRPNTKDFMGISESFVYAWVGTLINKSDGYLFASGF